MKKTVLESGNEALKQMGADRLKKKQFIVCRTNSKVNNQGHSERFKMNDSYTEALFVFRSLTEVPFLFFLNTYLRCVQFNQYFYLQFPASHQRM